MSNFMLLVLLEMEQKLETEFKFVKGQAYAVISILLFLSRSLQRSLFSSGQLPLSLNSLNGNKETIS